MAHGVAVPQHVVLADRRGEGGDQDGDDNHDQQGDFKISFLGDLVVNVLYTIYILLYIYRNIVYRYRLFPLKGNFWRTALQGGRKGGTSVPGFLKRRDEE